MREKNEKLMMAIGQIDEKYVKESEGKMKRPYIKAVASLAIVVALSLWLFIPFAPVTSDLSAYRGSDYFPLIEEIDDYILSFKQPVYKNNFEGLTAIVKDIFDFTLSGGSNMNGGSAPGNDMGADGSPEFDNGEYVESTDNQVSGVIESDLFKMTDKYIFRLAYKMVYSDPLGKYDQYRSMIRVYSIDKENTAVVAEFEIPLFDGENHRSQEQMYLSVDASTVTLLKNYTDDNGKSHVGITSVDVSDINNISTKTMVSLEGSMNTSRMVDGKLLLISEFVFNRARVDYDDPTTYVPSIDFGDGPVPVNFDDIIFPDTVGNTRYSVVSLFDSENLELLGANALLNFTNDVYVSENNVYITREYTKEIDVENPEYNRCTGRFTDVAVLNYAGDALENKGIITVRGWAEDQYSFDEKDGYLRVVTTTLENYYYYGETVSSASFNRNASLYIYDLTDNSLAYSLEDFAIEGEEATAVRFDGDMVYVCTAIVVNFTDPVYFIDLSDYESIISADTGIIEGYSDHLINYGDGFLLGIGREGWSNSKVEVYEQQGSEVVSVDVFRFDGNYSTDYKAYLVNRKENLFGFGVKYYYVVNNDNPKDYVYYDNAYVLLQFNGYELIPIVIELDHGNCDNVRAAYVDGYLYITSHYDITVVKVK